MTLQYPQFVEADKTTIGGLPSRSQIVNYGLMPEADTEYRDIGHRLEAIRTGFSELSQKAWAEKHGFQQTQWNNWEKGTRRISLENAERLCVLYGLTLDFIYRGRRDGLSDKASKVL